jgi:hypothetical protein
MTILHVRLRGPTTTITLPPSMNNARFKLKSARVLFNRDSHGYYLALITSSLFDEGNVISYSKSGEPSTRFCEIPLLLNPESKNAMVFPIVDWDMGRARGGGSVIFNLQFESCIERKRFSQAVFDSGDPSIAKYYGQSVYQPYYGTTVPMYMSPNSNLVSNNAMSSVYSVQQPPSGSPIPFTTADFGSNSLYAPDGTNITPTPAPTNKPFPNASLWVHTGVQIGNVDPQPGGQTFDTAPVSVEEANIIAKSGGQLTGSGFRRNAIPYAYSVDLIFEVTS